jgi:AcrR family transcriptional regulator
VRNPEAHRAAILTAARSVFGEHGDAKGAIREIARRANVTHGLVVRHFETKEQLFVAALLDTRREQAVIGRDVHELPELLARRYIEQVEADGFSRYILADGPLRDMSADELIPYLATAIRAILFSPVQSHD